MTLLQGTLDLILLRVLVTMGPQHSYGLAARLEQMCDGPFALNQGTLYPVVEEPSHGRDATVPSAVVPVTTIPIRRTRPRP
ncbi:MAG: hypothetical protein GEU99_22735 [Luteitalea sp.]|nr:hypothetical protein [Luteitalea sp.]